MDPIRGAILILRACKFARQPKESGAQFAQGQALPFFGETGPLKSRDQVVGQPNYLQIECVSRKSTSGNLPQRIVVTELPDAWFHFSTAIVEVPHPGRCQGQVRVPGSIHVTFQGKQSWLRIGLLDPVSCHDTTPCLRPIARMMLKFRDLPVRIERFIAQTFEGKFQGGGHSPERDGACSWREKGRAAAWPQPDSDRLTCRSPMKSKLPGSDVLHWTRK
jgi:hypothetical protein